MSDDKQASFWDKLNGNVKDLWAKEKGFVILFGVLILIVKFREVLIKILVASAKQMFDKAKKESDQLQKSQNEHNAEANRLVEKAKKLTEADTSVDSDWYKK